MKDSMATTALQPTILEELQALLAFYQTENPQPEQARRIRVAINRLTNTGQPTDYTIIDMRDGSLEPTGMIERIASSRTEDRYRALVLTCQARNEREVGERFRVWAPPIRRLDRVAAYAGQRWRYGVVEEIERPGTKWQRYQVSWTTQLGEHRCYWYRNLVRPAVAAEPGAVLRLGMYRHEVAEGRYPCLVRSAAA